MGDEKIQQLFKEIRKISDPIIKFLKENYNPHTTVIINEDSIKVVSDEIFIPVDIKTYD